MLFTIKVFLIIKMKGKIKKQSSEEQKDNLGHFKEPLQGVDCKLLCGVVWGSEFTRLEDIIIHCQ